MAAYHIPRSRRLLDVIVYGSLIGGFWLAPNQDPWISIVGTVPSLFALLTPLYFLLMGNPAVVISDENTVSVTTAFKTYVFDRGSLRISCTDVPIVGATTLRDLNLWKTFTYGDVPRAALEVCGILPVAKRQAPVL
jgi:hypothetical protein